jgi:lactoylglutathione lyase
MAKIEHIALWANDIENLKNFYQRYFSAHVSTKYHNPIKQFQSYFLYFSSGARLEIMQIPEVVQNNRDKPSHEYVGYAHLAFSLGSKQMVEKLTRQLKSDGYEIVSGPRQTGDGYYESVILDPENNRIELTV